MTITPAAELQLLHVDPRTLGVRDQARADATPDAELIESVRRHGIMQPPTVMLDADVDGYVILMGHRRVGAAIAAGLTEITVIVRPGDDADEVLNLETQIVENERRKALSASEVAQGYKKLELFGRTPEDIAAELGEKPDRVRAGLRVAASQKTSELVDAEPTINLEQAAIIAEFDDNPKLQERLINVATQRPANFGNEVHSVRKEIELAEKLAAIKQAAKDAGTKIAETLNYDGGSYWNGRDGKGIVIDRLANANGEPMRDTDHRGCPGEAILITGAWHIDNLKTLNVCTDWEANGHTKHTPALAPREKTPEEIAEAAEWERRNIERQQRIEAQNENTRARREWIRGFLNGRLNQTAGIFDIIATGLITAPISSMEQFNPGTAIEILTGERPARWDLAEQQLAEQIKTGKLLPLRALAVCAIATLEETTHHTWGTAYLRQLESWGYQLTDLDLEQIARNEEADAEDADENEGDDQ